MMTKIALLFLCCFPGATAMGQIPITSSTMVYTQNFDGLDTMGTNLTKMPAGWGFKEWGGTGANNSYRSGIGNSNIGDTYSFGLQGSPDRSLGSVCSGAGNPSTGVPNVVYGVTFTNNTATLINSFDIIFKVEQWRRGGAGIIDSVLFYYSTSAGASVFDTTFSSWTQVPSLLMTSIARASPAAAINGNDSSKKIAASVPIVLPPGASVTMRWYDFNSNGSDDGLSIDSLTIAFKLWVPDFHPHIVILSPTPGATNVPVSPGATLSIGFDRNVTKGYGNIYLSNRSTHVTLTIPTSDSSVSVKGMTVAITGPGLQYGNRYHVTMDSTAFDTSAFHCVGIYDTTSWTFTTSYPQEVGSTCRPLSLVVTAMNPIVNGSMTIRFMLSRSRPIQIFAFDLNGRIVFKQRHPGISGENVVVLKTEMPPGNYLLQVSDGEFIGHVKVAVL